MQKVEGVESVRVSLNDGLTVLDLKGGNTITLARLRKIIKDSGFVSKDIRAVASGSIEQRGGQPLLIVSGSGETLTLSAAPDAKNVFDEVFRRTQSGPWSDAEVAGTIEATTMTPAPMRVQAVK